MDKSKITFKKIERYLREVSVVVLGVAITLSVTVWINNRSEKRDMVLYLNAMKIELEENIKVIDRVIEYLQPAANYEKYLRTHDKKSLNEDTLVYYANSCCYILNKYVYKTNTFEMFKSSGVMRLVNDKTLLMSIWDVYTDFISQNETLKWYSDSKWEHMEKDLVFVENSMMDFSKLPNRAPMYNFFNSGLTSSILKDCENILENTKRTVSKLEQQNCKKVVSSLR